MEFTGKGQPLTRKGLMAALDRLGLGGFRKGLRKHFSLTDALLFHIFD